MELSMAITIANTLPITAIGVAGALNSAMGALSPQYASPDLQMSERCEETSPFSPASTRRTLLERTCDALGINRRFHSPGDDDVEMSPEVITSPVQATVAYMGNVEKGQTIRSKRGRRIYLEEVMGDRAQLFSGGFYINFYLSPNDKHYWRVPYDGIFTYTQVNEGKSFLPIFIGLENIFRNADLFDLAVRYNASIASVLQTDAFPIGMVAVGSLNVNAIHVTYREGVPCSKGDPCGYFSLGSSMLLFFPDVDLSELVVEGRRIDVGQPIVRIGKGPSVVE